MERTLIITALITTSLIGFGFWFRWQRTKRRNDAGLSEHFSRTSDTAAEKPVTQSADKGTPMSRPELGSAAEKKATDHAAPPEPSTRSQAENHVAPQEIGRPSDSRTEEQPLATLGSDYGKDAKGESPREQVSTTEALPSAQTLRELAGEVPKNAEQQIPQEAQDGAGPAEQHLIPDASVETAEISHQASREKQGVSTAEATLGIGHEPHVGNAPPETEAARTVHQCPSDDLTPADAVAANVSPPRPAGLVDEDPRKKPKRYQP